MRESCQALHVPRDSVEAFVYNSDQTNAQSILISENKCIIRISSRLVDILTPQELCFVIGHELGHFIYEHAIKTDNEEGLDEEGFLLSKAAEISADRAGLIASHSTRDAIRSILKSISGLSSNHLGDDFSSFLDQFHNPMEDHDLSSFFRSHPSFLVRARALLWFDLVRNESNDGSFEQKMARLNHRIIKEMDRAFDSHSKKKISKAEKDVFLWLCLQKALEDGVFSKKEQDFFAVEFSQEILESLKCLIVNEDHQQVLLFVEKELERTTNSLRKIEPRRFEEVMARLRSDSHSFC
jgi:hypothetical protein